MKMKALAPHPATRANTARGIGRFAVGLALFRLFGSARRAARGPVTYFLYCGMLYLQWGKTLYNVRNPRVAEQLCGPGRALAPDNRYADADLGWRYINGRCDARMPLERA